MLKDIKVSIAKKLLLHLYLISTSVAAVITVITSYIDYSRESKDLHKSADQIEAVAIQGVAALLWNRDIESIGAQMNSILQNPIVYKITILDDSDAVVFSSDSNDSKSPQHSFERSADIKYDSGAGAAPIGRIKFIMSEDKVIDGVVSRFLAVLLLNALKAVLVSYLLYRVLRRIITRPIEDLVNYFRATPVPRSESVNINIHDRDTGNDEISELVDYIRAREKSLGLYTKENLNKIQSQAEEIEQVTEKMQFERERAELSARMAQLGEMAAGIAHEVNNPLTIINGYIMRARLELQKIPIDITRVSDTMTSIEKTSVRIAKIISGLRAYARDGRHDPFTPSPIATIIADAAEMCRGRLKQGDVDLRLSNALPDNLMMDCRATQISQVLVIMINNSFDAVRKMESPWVEIGSAQEGEHVILTVTDSGKGISPEIEKKIFEPFFTTKAVGEGTGLGLSVAFGIIKGHSGEIYINKNCANTQFVVRLPIRQVADMGVTQSAS